MTINQISVPYFPNSCFTHYLCHWNIILENLVYPHVTYNYTFFPYPSNMWIAHCNVPNFRILFMNLRCQIKIELVKAQTLDKHVVWFWFEASQIFSTQLFIDFVSPTGNGIEDLLIGLKHLFVAEIMLRIIEEVWRILLISEKRLNDSCIYCTQVKILNLLPFSRQFPFWIACLLLSRIFIWKVVGIMNTESSLDGGSIGFACIWILRAI